MPPDTIEGTSIISDGGFENFVAHIPMLLDSPRQLQNWKESLDSAKNELATAIVQYKSKTTINELTEQVNRAIDKVQRYTEAVRALEALAKFVHEHKLVEVSTT